MRTGWDRSGQVRAGQDRSGQVGTGQDRVGQVRTSPFFRLISVRQGMGMGMCYGLAELDNKAEFVHLGLELRLNLSFWVQIGKVTGQYLGSQYSM